MKWRFAPVGKNPLSPRPWMIADRSSPSRVRFAASRLGLLRADPKRWLFMKERGVRAVWTGRKGTFRPYQPLEPQPRGAVTRRAVAQRRSRASGLIRPSAAAIRGFGVDFVSGSLARFAAICRKYFVFSSLLIKEGFGFVFCGGR